MPEVLATVLAQDGLGWLVVATFVAGAVRGFAGFGTALVYLPVASQFLPPVWTLISLVVMDVFGPLPNLPRARRDGRTADVAWLLVGMVVALPLGLMVLYAVRPEIFRYVVSLVALAAPVLLASGLRYRGTPGRGLLLGTGGVSGFLGGIAGLPGPPVILLYMASSGPVQTIRANIMMYLFTFDVVVLALLTVQGRAELAPVGLGLLLAVPNLLGNLAGAAMFHPERQRIYRAVGYTVITAAAISGLPLWDQTR
ncbi:sulfite exporter TauE/SafE family protein [Thalassovita sp.]|uniref:sulfite exporter TauE/SafE family protein n=1 Tax=Thalassovita sp. TaxID=1979401 RepID=UPI0029DE8F4E|nr:sulfite exporter TauE/SafE family protein [Thalassovita sp.]